MPCDVTAASEADALDQAGSCIAETMQCAWEAYLADGDAETFDRAIDEIEQWQPIARRVARPAVALEPRAEIIDTVRGGKVVSQLYDYGEATGTESFDVLIARMADRRRAWAADAVCRPPMGRPQSLWLDAVLADIRAALEPG